MSLTGSLFLGLVLLVTLAAFVAVVVFWRRLTGSAPHLVLARVVALVVVNLLVLLTAATQLNAAYLFFASWGDLQGALTGHVAQTRLDRGGQASNAPSLKVKGYRAHTASVITAPGGGQIRNGLLSFQVTGPQSGLTGTVLVHVPQGYTPTSSQRYPVLEAFHGYPSEPLNWIKVFHIDQAVQQQVTEGHLHPSIVVMPQIEFPEGVDTEGVNGGPGQPQIETWLTRDVPDWVAQHFRVDSRRSGWATIGYSAGGFDAAMATVLHPAQYGAGIILGGYFRPEFGPFYQPFTQQSQQGQYYDLPQVARTNPPPVALWLETSHADVVSYTSSARFLHDTRSPTAVHAVVLQNAGHRDSVWIALLPEALQWLGSTAAGFAP